MFKLKLVVDWSAVSSVLLATMRVGCVKNENSELIVCVAWFKLVPVEVVEVPELLPVPVGKVIPVLDEEPESDEEPEVDKADAEADKVTPLLADCDDDAEGEQFGSTRPSTRPQLAEVVGEA